MRAHPHPGTSTLGSVARNRSGQSTLGRSIARPGGASGLPVFDVVHATMAVMSRCANATLTQQLEHAYAIAARMRDYAKAAAATAARDCTEGPARVALLVVLERQEAGAEQMMQAVMRYGRDHGHLAFAFPVHR